MLIFALVFLKSRDELKNAGPVKVTGPLYTSVLHLQEAVFLHKGEKYIYCSLILVFGTGVLLLGGTSGEQTSGGKEEGAIHTRLD